MAEDIPPGWYTAEGDPPGTERYWDGSAWRGGPRRVFDGTPHDRVFAAPWQRIVARLIDYTVLLFALVITVSIYPQVLAGLVVVAGYEIAFVALKGATPGKMIMGLQVITQERGISPPGWLPAGLRYLPNLIQPLVLVSLVLLFVDDRRRTLSDMAGKTYVVQKID